MMDDGSSVLLKSDITPSPCSMDKLEIASAKSPDSISSQCSKMSSTTNQSNANTNSNNNNNNSSDVFRTDKLATEERPVEVNTEDMEPALRRSKRGKGRPSNVHNNNNSNNNNNDGSSDDHVPSCIVSGVEYRTGDFVYYEEPDFEYFTIGLIEEIKVSRRDKFSVFIKCFYRTRDIPEISKQALPDRDNYPANSNVKFIRDIFARELFVSEVQETLPAKQLRGVCKVNYLPDLKTALTTFSPDEDDSFFYVFAYNPETRRLSKIRAEIRVGQAYQAALPEFRHHPPAAYRFNNRNHCVNHSRKRKRCTHKSADQDTHSLPQHYDHHHHHHPRKHRRTSNASPHQLTTVNTLHNHELQPSNNDVSSDALDDGGTRGGDGGDICGTASKMSDGDDDDHDNADADDNKPLINKPKMDIPKSPKKLDTFNNDDNDDHVDDHHNDDEDMPCKTEATVNASVDLSESIKNVQKIESSSISEPLAASNLPPKLENANHFDDDHMSVDPMNTDDLDHPPHPQPPNHHHYHNHHRHHQCHPACNHKNHVYPGSQSHHRKRRRGGGGHRRCRRRKSQKREVLVWSPCGLSSALSGSCKDFNSIIASTTVNDHQNNPHTVDNDDNNNNNNNANTVLNSISSDFNSMLSDEPLKNYLDAVRSMVAFFGFGGAEDDLSSAENGLVLANLAATTQHAYDTLHKCKYSLRNALQAISCNPIVAKDTPRHWTAEQVRLFAHALRIHGKDFFTIQRNFFGGKTSTNNNNNNNNNSNTNNINNNNSATNANGGTGRIRGRGRRKLVPASSNNGTASASKLSSMKSDESEGCNSTTATVTSASTGGKLEEVKSEDAVGVSNTESLNDNGESAENNATTRLNDGNGNTPSGLLAATTTSEPVKTVKELIAFYYYWKRKGTSSSSLGGGHGGLSAAAANFATAVVAAALNTDNTLPSSSVNNSGVNGGVASAAVAASEAGNNSNGNIFSSSQTHFNASSVKKRKATNRGCVLTKQAWLGIIEYRKAAEYELRRLLTLKAEKGVGADGGGGGQQQTTVNYQSLTQQTGDDKSESVGPSQPESEVEENFETTNAGTDDAVDVPVNSGEKNEDGTTISTTTTTTVDGNTDSASTSRLRKRLCRNCSAELLSSEDSPPPPLLGQLRFLCPGCRIHLQKYGELKCTVEEQEENIIDDAVSEVTHPITNGE
ncbi:unnamed protein product [Trichobilharzia szidati]|nr:unnamed protein product [Trichobilharzia szidati]